VCCTTKQLDDACVQRSDCQQIILLEIISSLHDTALLLIIMFYVTWNQKYLTKCYCKKIMFKSIIIKYSFDHNYHVGIYVKSIRRNELTIMTHVLTYLIEPRRTTHILYRTNLSYYQLKKYLASLLRMGLAEEINEPHRAFRITEKGRVFIQLIDTEQDSFRSNV